jgi:hypothetical protein
MLEAIAASFKYAVFQVNRMKSEENYVNGQYEEEMEDPEGWSVVSEKLGIPGSFDDVSTDKHVTVHGKKTNMELLELMHNDDIVSENMHCKEVTEI